eukprot:515319-Rhodomonas_salina.1
MNPLALELLAAVEFTGTRSHVQVDRDQGPLWKSQCPDPAGVTTISVYRSLDKGIHFPNPCPVRIQSHVTAPGPPASGPSSWSEMTTQGEGQRT